MKLKLSAILQWFDSHKKIWLIAIGASVLLLVSWSIYIALRVDDAVIRTNPSSTVDENMPAIEFETSPLTGLDVSPEAARRPVLGMMISNSTEARPQSGLHKAGVVYEAIAEGGITRYLALFQDELPELLGPVRSVRPYFVDWVAPFDAYFGHVGGSVQGRADAAALGDRDVDQFANGQYYFRSTDRFAPHNVYTTSEMIEKMMSDRGNEQSEFSGFERTDEESPLETITARTITVNVSSGLYEVGYTYNKDTNSYSRRLGGSAHRDRETLTQMTPKNVAVIKVPTSFIANDRLGMDTTGTGDAWVFRDGGVIKGTWAKASDSDQLTFKKKNGDVAKLNPGSTWITVIPTTQDVTYKP